MFLGAVVFQWIVFYTVNIYSAPLYNTVNVYRRICHLKVEKDKYTVKNIFFSANINIVSRNNCVGTTNYKRISHYGY